MIYAPYLTRLYRDRTIYINLNERSLGLLDEILELLDRIVPIRKHDNAHSLWIDVPRGSLEEWERLNGVSHSESASVIARRNKRFLYWYPDEVEWFQLFCVHEKQFRHLRFGEMIIEIDDVEHYAGFTMQRFPTDFTEFLSFLKTKILSILNELEAGTFNERVERELPYFHRYGSVPRSIYWKLRPDDKKEELKDLTQEEIDYFIALVEKEGNDYLPPERIHEMTFRKYFEFAMMGYKAANFDLRSDDVVKEFLRLGEDFGSSILYEIDYDSPTAFDDYYNDRLNAMGGHPWGIMRGSSRSRVMLRPKFDNGYYFLLGGNENWSCYELVKPYIALKQGGVPVRFAGAASVIKYLKEKDYVGIVPHSSFPAYCQGGFSKHKVDDFRHWHKEDHPDLEPFIEWEPVSKLRLK